MTGFELDGQSINVREDVQERQRREANASQGRGGLGVGVAHSAVADSDD